MRRTFIKEDFHQFTQRQIIKQQNVTSRLNCELAPILCRPMNPDALAADAVTLKYKNDDNNIAKGEHLVLKQLPILIGDRMM